MNFLKDEEQSCCKEPTAWKEVTKTIIGASASDEKTLIDTITSKTNFKDDQQRNHILGGLRWLGLFSDEKVSSIPDSSFPTGFKLLREVKH